MIMPPINGTRHFVNNLGKREYCKRCHRWKQYVFFLVTPLVHKMAPVGSGNMAMPQSITAARAGLSGAFNKTVPWIPSSGTCNHQGMPDRPRVPKSRRGLHPP